MTLYRRLLPYAAEQHGYVTSQDVRAAGGTAMAVVMLAQRGVLEHVGRGIYRVPELAGDRLAQYQEALLRLPGAVLSHETALDLLDVADVNPRRVHVTLPRTFRARKEMPLWLEIHRAGLGPDDVDHYEGLAITTPGRTIVDAITAHLGRRVTDGALEAATRRNLLSTADELRIAAASAAVREAGEGSGR